MSIIPSSTQRVKLNTKKELNQKIEQKTIDSINKHVDSDTDTLTKRLSELNHEWDTERFLEANAATIILISSVIGYLTEPYWFIVTGFISFFLLQHAVQGWCPPLPIIRKLGIRTPTEINEEKLAIKYLRGDFSRTESEAADIMKIVKRD